MGSAVAQWDRKSTLNTHKITQEEYGENELFKYNALYDQEQHTAFIVCVHATDDLFNHRHHFIVASITIRNLVK